MGRTLTLAIGTSLTLTAALLASWALLSTANLPLEWAGAGLTEPQDRPVIALAQH